jgi:hypothetical protein
MTWFVAGAQQSCFRHLRNPSAPTTRTIERASAGRANLTVFANPHTRSPSWYIPQGARKRLRCFVAFRIQLSAAIQFAGVNCSPLGLTKAEKYQLQERFLFFRCSRSSGIAGQTDSG